MPAKSPSKGTGAGPFGGVNTLLILVSAVTFATTLLGVGEIIPTAWDWWTRHAVGLASATGLSFFVFWSWRSAAPALRYRRWGAFFFWIVIGLVPSLTSALLSSTIHMAFFSMFQLNQIALGEARKEVLAPVSAFTNQAQQISTKMTEFSVFAADRSELEKRTGQSCEGQDLGAECGPVCRWRAAQARDANSMADLAAAIDRDGAALTFNAADLDQSKINEIFLSARELARDPRFAQIKNWIAQQQRAFLSGFEWEGIRRQCSDPEAMTKLAELEDIVTEEPELPLTPPMLREQTVADSGSRNLHAIFRVFGLLAQFRLDDAVSELGAPNISPFVPFWATSVILELLCALLSLAHGRARMPDRGLPRHLQSLSDRGEIGPEARDRMQLMLRIHRSFKVTLGGGATYFLTPAGGGDLRVQNNAEFYTYCMRLIEYDVPPMDVDTILEAHAPWLHAVSGGATKYRIWRYRSFSRRFSVQAIEASLVQALGITATDGPESPPGAPRLQVIGGRPSAGGAVGGR